MNSLITASSLVPSRKQAMQPLVDEVSSMSLSDLLSALVLPKDELEYTNNLVGVVQHFRKRDIPPLQEITTGIVETFREVQDLSQDAVDHQHEGLNLLKRIAKWGITKIVKWVFKFAFRMMLRFARWMFKRIIINGVRALVEWVVRPILMEALEFIGFNPELWPFIAIAGGVAGIGYTAWKMFFDKPKDTKVDSAATTADSLLADQKQAAEGIKTVPLVPQRLIRAKELVEAKPVPPTVARAAAPMAAGAPVPAVAPTGDDKSIMALIERHEGIRLRPYKDSLGLWTIGVGHLIGDGKSLPPEWDREFGLHEVQALFAQDYVKHKQAATKIPGFSTLSNSGKAALIDITYNLGPNWWHSWPSFTKFMQQLDISGAIRSLISSKWYHQVGRRAAEDIALLEHDITGVRQSPSVVVAQSTQTLSTNASNSSSSTSVDSTVRPKDYIKGPKGSIVAIS